MSGHRDTLGDGGRNTHIPQGSIPHGARPVSSVAPNAAEAGGGAKAQVKEAKPAFSSTGSDGGGIGQLGGKSPKRKAEEFDDDGELLIAHAVKFEEVEGGGNGRREGAAVGDGDGDGDGEPSDVFLGVYYHKGRLGIAVYEEDAATLSLCEMKDGGAEMEVRASHKKALSRAQILRDGGQGSGD